MQLREGSLVLGRLSRLWCGEHSLGLGQVLLPPPFIPQLGGLSAAVPLAELLRARCSWEVGENTRLRCVHQIFPVAVL